MASEAISTVETLADTLAQLIGDEKWPDYRFCPICFIGFPRLLAHSGEPAIPILQTRHHGFLDTCIMNLAAQLSPSEKVALDRRLQHTTRRCRVIKGKTHTDKLRESDHSHIDDPLALFHSMLCGVLVSCLYGFDRNSDRTHTRPPVDRAYNSHKPFRSSKGLWPTRIDQLFPFGPERTVEGIIECCCTFANRDALVLLGALLNLVRPRVWDVLLQPTNLHRLSWAISTTLFLSIPGGYETLLARDPARLHLHGFEIPARWREAKWLRDGKGIQSVASLLYTIKAGNYALPDDSLRFCAPHGDLLGPAVRAALDYCGTDGLEVDADQTFTYYLAALQRDAQMRVLSQRIDDVALERAVERDPRSRGVLALVRLALCWLLTDRRCAGPHCARTMLDRFDAEDKPLSTCARCRIVRYCSKPCQQADWKAGQPVPHKQLCPIFARLRGAADPAVTDEAQLVLQCGFSDAQLVTAGKWALSRGQVMRDHLRECLWVFSARCPAYE